MQCKASTAERSRDNWCIKQLRKMMNNNPADDHENQWIDRDHLVEYVVVEVALMLNSEPQRVDKEFYNGRF